MWFQQWIQDCRWLLGPTLTLIVFDKDNLCKEELNIGSKKETHKRNIMMRSKRRIIRSSSLPNRDRGVLTVSKNCLTSLTPLLHILSKCHWPESFHSAAACLLWQEAVRSSSASLWKHVFLLGTDNTLSVTYSKQPLQMRIPRATGRKESCSVWKWMSDRQKRLTDNSCQCLLCQDVTANQAL